MTKRQKLVRLVHNPGAGVGKVHYKDEIAELIESAGYQCEYSSSKKRALKKIAPHTSLIAIAGGDGTIRQTILTLLDKKLKHRKPIALLPLGTANNIAGAFGIENNVERNISSWDKAKANKLDIGQVLGLVKPLHFIESFGFGLFPKLMRSMKRKETKPDVPEDEFKMALKALSALAATYKGFLVRVEVGGEVLEQECIMAEIMNISSLGPKLNLCSEARPGDGYFDIVMVGSNQRELLQSHIDQLLAGKKTKFPIQAIRTKKLTIEVKGKDVHADDQLIKTYGQQQLEISLLEGLIEVMA